MTRRGTTRAAALAVTLATLLGAPAALAVPDCPGAQAPQTVLTGAGLLETIVFDDQGRLVIGELGQGRTLRLDSATGQPSVLSEEGGTGLSTLPGGLLTTGLHTAVLPPETGIVGLEAEPAIAGLVTATGSDGSDTLATIDPETGDVEVVAEGLSIVNGVAYSPIEDAYYVSNHEAGFVERVAPDGSIDHRWKLLPSANGLVVDPTGRWLYAVQTFGLSRLTRIDLEDPSSVEVVASADPASEPAGLDGLRLGPGGTFYAAAHGSGEVWRIAPDGSICALARGIDPGLDGPSDVAVGSGVHGFPATSLYVTTFSGKLLELPGAVTQ